MRVRLTALLPAMLAAGCATNPDKDPVQLRLNDLEARVARMERIVTNEAQVSQNVDEMQGSLRELRGDIEELQHNNETLNKQQRAFYTDLDKRLSAAGGGSGVLAGSNAPSPTEQAVYGQAFDALKAGSYSIAITGFKDFLKTYPDSSLADNAQYWLGEAYYVSHEYDSAAGSFRTVLKKWPDSPKAPDAMLKLGYTQFAQKQFPAARATLDEVTRKYPGTDSAKLAAERLRRMPAQPSQ